MAKNLLIGSISLFIILSIILIATVVVGVVAIGIGKAIQSEGVSKLGYVLVGAGLVLLFLLVTTVISILAYKVGGVQALFSLSTLTLNL